MPKSIQVLKNRYKLLLEAIRKDDIPGAMYAIAIGHDVNGPVPSTFNSPRIPLLEDPSAEVNENQPPVGSPSNKSLSHQAIDLESIKKELDMSYFVVRYPLHFALLHGRIVAAEWRGHEQGGP